MPRGYSASEFILGNTFGKPEEETKSYYLVYFPRSILFTKAFFVNILFIS